MTTYNRTGNALVYDFTIENGASLDLNFTYQDAAGDSLITESASARMTIKDYIGGNSLMSLTTENSRITLNSSTGAFGIDLTSTETQSLSAYDTAVYDFELVTSSSVKRLLRGVINFSHEVTT